MHGWFRLRSWLDRAQGVPPEQLRARGPHGRVLHLLARQVQQHAGTARVPHLWAGQVLSQRQQLAAALRGRYLQQRGRGPCQGRLLRVYPRHRVHP